MFSLVCPDPLFLDYLHVNVSLFWLASTNLQTICLQVFSSKHLQRVYKRINVKSYKQRHLQSLRYYKLANKSTLKALDTTSLQKYHLDSTF